ncbi:MAG: adenylate/guanylate cyclase domain-containing protein [Burkholderiales bacterium]
MNDPRKISGLQPAAKTRLLDTEDEKLNHDLLIFAAGLMMIPPVLWLAIYWAFGQKLSTFIPLLYQALSCLSLLYYSWSKNFELLRTLQLSLFLFFPFVMQWSIGDFVSSSGVALWAIMAPIGALIFHGRRESVPWFVAFVIFTAMSGVFDFYLADLQPSRIPMRTVAVFFVLNFAAISAIVYVLFRHFADEKSRARKLLKQEHHLLQLEQDRSEKLLLNILPQPIAQRLMLEEKNIADGFPNVSVMFADIVNFTQLAGDMPPNRMVSLLNDIFSGFDMLAERHGLEKIKTIGDAYMVAGGLDDSGSQRHADAIADMALDMLDWLRNYPAARNTRLELRIGIGSGPVVAGVIGIKRFIYDLWGDTVNIASRMASDAAVGAVQVDATTYQLLRNRYRFGDVQQVPVKGKGMMEVYLLQGKQ